VITSPLRLHIKRPLTPPYPRRGTNTNSQYILTLNPSPKERDFEQPPHPNPSPKERDFEQPNATSPLPIAIGIS